MGKRLIHHAAVVADIVELIPQLRPGDRNEVLAADGDIVRGCVNALDLSDQPIAMRDHEGGLIAVYGVASQSLLGEGQAAPWLLGTERMRVNALSVYHDMKLYVRWLGEHYTRLFNYVDARNVESIGWLAGLGFTIGGPEPRGPYKLPFHPFWMDLV